MKFQHSIRRNSHYSGYAKITCFYLRTLASPALEQPEKSDLKSLLMKVLWVGK